MRGSLRRDQLLLNQVVCSVMEKLRPRVHDAAWYTIARDQPTKCLVAKLM